MPVSSVYFNVLQSVGNIISNLGLTFTPAGGSPISPVVEVLKEPKVQEWLETQGQPGEPGSQRLPCIGVAPTEERQRDEPSSFHGYVFMTYPVDVAISAGGNRDFASNLDVWLDWRQQIRRQFQGTLLLGVSEVFDTDTDPDPSVDRETLQDNLDRSKLTIRFKALEVRGTQITSTTTTTTT